MSDSDITLQPADVVDATDLPEQPLPLIREPSSAQARQDGKINEIGN